MDKKLRRKEIEEDDGIVVISRHMKIVVIQLYKWEIEIN